MRAHLACLALGLGACASPNLYVSARPLGPGVIQHTIAVEGLAAATPAGAAILPSAPTWQVRFGVTRRLDLMARLVNLSGLGLDGLISLHEGELDVALVPGVRGAWLPFSAGRPGVLSGHLPLLLGVHLGDRLTLMLSAGGGFLATLGASASAEDTSKVLAESAEASSKGFFVRGGVGLRWRVTQGLILQPEVTLLYTPATRRASIVGGLGFTFGALEPGSPSK